MEFKITVDYPDGSPSTSATKDTEAEAHKLYTQMGMVLMPGCKVTLFAGSTKLASSTVS